MKWSQLKKRIEATFADSVKGRVQVWKTRHRKSYDQWGTTWLTFDKELVAEADTYTYWNEVYHETKDLRNEQPSEERNDSDCNRANSEAYWAGVERVQQRGVYESVQVSDSLFEYLNMSIDNAFHSVDPVVRAIAALDRRVGHRRLKALDVTKEHPLVRTLYRIRCEVEGIEIEPKCGCSDDATGERFGTYDQL